MYGKIEDGKLIIAGQEIQIENGWITNPTEEQLIANGYKLVEYTEKPTYDKEEEKLVETYREDIEQTTILVCYEIVALTDEEHNAVILAEIIEEEAKITPRNIRGALLNIQFDVNAVTTIENNIVVLRSKLR